MTSLEMSNIPRELLNSRIQVSHTFKTNSYQFLT